LASFVAWYDAMPQTSDLDARVRNVLTWLEKRGKTAADDQFLSRLPLIERASTDQRNFVKKGVSWALRAVGRRNSALNTAGVATAIRLISSDSPSARWTDGMRSVSSRAPRCSDRS
jgi:3-methyladenine DNA glycosylase AlkD